MYVCCIPVGLVTWSLHLSIQLLCRSVRDEPESTGLISKGLMCNRLGQSAAFMNFRDREPRSMPPSVGLGFRRWGLKRFPRDDAVLLWVHTKSAHIGLLCKQQQGVHFFTRLLPHMRCSSAGFGIRNPSCKKTFPWLHLHDYGEQFDFRCALLWERSLFSLVWFERITSGQTVSTRETNAVTGVLIFRNAEGHKRLPSYSLSGFLTSIIFLKHFTKSWQGCIENLGGSGFCTVLSRPVVCPGNKSYTFKMLPHHIYRLLKVADKKSLWVFCWLHKTSLWVHAHTGKATRRLRKAGVLSFYIRKSQQLSIRRLIGVHRSESLGRKCEQNWFFRKKPDN